MQKAKQKYPDSSEEIKCRQHGHKIVVGLDEVGRGPLAGPVVAAAVCVAANLKFEIRDSKKLSPKQRDLWYEILTKHPDIKWAIGAVSERVIDKINIFEATKLAMMRAIANLKIEPEFLLLDGNFTLEKLSISQKAIVRGDERVFSCAAASIIAKVTRDRLMCRMSKKYPEYAFEKHKGYGTQLHRETIKKHGPCKIHRLSFKSVCKKDRDVL
jgi:ribonuclease HII